MPIGVPQNALSNESLLAHTVGLTNRLFAHWGTVNERFRLFRLCLTLIQSRRGNICLLQLPPLDQQNGCLRITTSRLSLCAPFAFFSIVTLPTFRLVPSCHELRYAMRSELDMKIAAMRSHCMGRDPQSLCCLLVCVAQGYMLPHLPLPPRQWPSS
jgi:hypothetical protein